jgi:hypothetical protein
MARISGYKPDIDVTKDDKVIGTDAGGGTRNYRLEDISKFLKNSDNVGKFVYKLLSDPPPPGGMNAVFSSGNTFANLTSVKVNKYTSGETNSSEDILATLASKDVLIVDIENQNNFGVYTAGTPTQDGSTDFYDISLSTVQNSNGSLVNEKFYSIVSYGGGADKNYASGSINTSDSRWSGSGPYVLAITHNLNKYGSPTIKDSANTIVYGKVSYNALNTLQLTFTAKFVCEVFVN